MGTTLSQHKAEPKEKLQYIDGLQKRTMPTFILMAVVLSQIYHL